MLCAAQEVWQDTAFLSLKLLRGWARLALLDRTWRWWSREFTPSLCLAALPCPSLNLEFPPGCPQILLPQKKAKPGTVGLTDNEQPTEAFGFFIQCQKQLGKWIIYLQCMLLSHSINCSFCEKLHADLLGLKPRMPLLGGTMCVSVVELLFTAQQAPQSALTVSSHMALFDKGHKHV